MPILSDGAFPVLDVTVSIRLQSGLISDETAEFGLLAYNVSNAEERKYNQYKKSMTVSSANGTTINLLCCHLLLFRLHLKQTVVLFLRHDSLAKNWDSYGTLQFE